MEYRLEEICIKVTDGSHFSPKDDKNSAIPMLSVKDMKEFDFDYTNCKHISEKDFQTMVRQDCVPKKEDLLVAKDGSYLKEIFVNKEENKKAILSSIAIFRPNKNIVNPYFLCYMLKNPFVMKYAKDNCVSGSALPRIILKAFKDIKLDIPDLLIQNKSVKIIKNINKKIINNNQINDNLYKMMKIKFEDWITNLNKYEVSSLSKIANYTNGLAMQKFRPKDNEESLPVIKIKEMNDGITENTERCSTNIKDEVIINNGDVLFAWSGTLCMSIWGKGKAGLNQHIFKVTSDKYPKWFYYFWTLKHLNKFKMIAAGKATTMGHIKRGELDISEVLIPEDKELQEMHKIMQPLFNKYINNLIQNETLTQLRDALLPKLMNGEIDLDKIEI